MVKISRANFGDLSEKKTVFIEFLEIIQNKTWEVELLGIKLSEMISISGRVGGFISDHRLDHVRSFLVGASISSGPFLHPKHSDSIL